jgi:hypothetical protein
MADEMRPAPSPSVDLWRPDGPAARALCKRLDPKWRRARIRALKRSRRNVETLKREGRCR